MKEPSYHFGRNLRRLRKAQRITQQALAEALGLKRSNISAYEDERARPSLGNAYKLACYFGYTMEEMLWKEVGA